MNNMVRVVPLIDTEGPSAGREDMYGTWVEIDTAVKELDGPVRESLRDSFDNPLVISWFVVDWTGYSSDDPVFRKRGHDNKLHAVYDFYKKGILSNERISQTHDGFYWHYHHPPKNGAWGFNKDWNDSNWHEYILGKLILNRNYFPSVYRAGKYVETNLNSHWLEKFIPFDYSCNSPVKQEFCDWSQAPQNWEPYHPSFENYQLPGEMKRWVARALPVQAKGGSGTLKREEIEKAFAEAASGKNPIFAYHTHDYYKSIHDEFKRAHKMIEEVSKEYGIKWKYTNALDALRVYATEMEKLTAAVEHEEGVIRIKPNHEIFGEPFVVSENIEGEITRIDSKKNNDFWTFAVPKKAIRWGFAIVDSYGNTFVTTK